MPSVMQMTRGQPASAASEDGVGGARRRHEDERDVGARFGDGPGDGVEHRHLAFECLAAAARRDPGDDLGAVLQALPSVKGACAAGDP